MNVYGIFSRKLKFLLLKKMKYFLKKINKIMIPKQLEKKKIIIISKINTICLKKKKIKNSPFQNGFFFKIKQKSKLKTILTKIFFFNFF